MFKFSYNAYVRFLFGILFYCSFVLHQYATSLAFSAAILIIISEIMRNKIRVVLNGSIFFYVIMSFILFIYGFTIGIVNGNGWSFLYPEIKVRFVYPVLMLLLAPSLARVFCLQKFMSLIIYISYSILIMIGISMVEFIYSVDLLPHPFRVGNLLYFSYYIDRFTISSLNLFCIFTMVPILFAMWKIGYRRRLASVALLFTLALIFFSGRSAFILLTLILIFLYFYSTLFKSSSRLVVYLSFLFALSILALALLSFGVLFEPDYSFVKPQGVRIYQIELFFEEFLKYPFGKGLGSTLIDSRSLENTSVFELEWGKLLVDVGVLYILHQFIFYLYFFIAIAKSVNGGALNIAFFANSTIAAFMIAILSSLTNPYLSNFDGFMIILFYLGAYDYFKFNIKSPPQLLGANKYKVSG